MRDWGRMIGVAGLTLAAGTGGARAQTTALPEILISIGMVAMEIMAYLFIVTRFPVLAREEH